VSVFNEGDIFDFNLTDVAFSCLEDTPTVDPVEVWRLLERIKSNAVGPDNVPGNIYKTFSEFLVEPLTILFNRSLSEGKLPTLWKCANIIPIPKSANEFCPISLLCHAVKILEKNCSQ